MLFAQKPLKSILCTNNLQKIQSALERNALKKKIKRKGEIHVRKSQILLHETRKLFTDAKMVILESMQDGLLYSNLLLKMYLSCP